MEHGWKPRGAHPGRGRIFSALEPCSPYRPWHDQATGRASLRPDDGQCRHDSFSFIDEELGWCSVRVPTGCPFRWQVDLHGHHRGARRRERKKRAPTRLGNAFIAIFAAPCVWSSPLNEMITPAYSQLLHRYLPRLACYLVAQLLKFRQ